MSIIRKFVLLISIQSFASPLFAYNLEHHARIINNSKNVIDVWYRLCDYKKSISQREYQISCADDKQITLNPFNQPGNYLPIEMDYFDSREIDKKNGYVIFHVLFISRLTFETQTTRFRTSADEQDDDPQTPLSPWCYTFFGGRSLVLDKYDDERYHCQEIF